MFSASGILQCQRNYNTSGNLFKLRYPYQFLVWCSLLAVTVFADASSIAYGACCFVRTFSAEGTHVPLLTSKSKVAPLSTHHSIAKLDLCSAHLATQLINVEALLKINSICYFWSDSRTGLQWLRSSPTRWKTCVGTRVSNIQNTACIDHGRHIAGPDNPADDISQQTS